MARFLRQSRFDIYKGKAAAQFKLIPYDDNRERDGRSRPGGFVLLEMAPFKEKRDGIKYYDWEKKTSFALSKPEEMGKIIIAPALIAQENGEPLEIFHKNGDKIKKLIISKAPDGKNLFFNLNAQADSGWINYSVTISREEFTALKELLNVAMLETIGWGSTYSLLTDMDERLAKLEEKILND